MQQCSILEWNRKYRGNGTGGREGFRQQEEPPWRYVRLDRQMRIRFQNLINCARLPVYGSRAVEDSKMEPFVEELEPMISGKLLLFGSYGWGDGEWMRDWCQRMKRRSTSDL